MRLVPVDKLKGNEIIAENIVRENGVTLLNKGTRYRESFKDKLLQYNIESLYIEDKVSEGIEPTPTVTREVKNELLGDFSKEISKLKSTNMINAECMVDVSNIIKIGDQIIEILSGKDAIYDLMNVRTNAYNIYESSIEVSIIAYMVCLKLGVPAKLIREIVVGSLLHDIGMILVPKEILNSKGKLSENDVRVVRSHTEMGYKMVKDNPTLSALSKLIVLCHHEREDGSGYPLRKGSDLHLGAKIVACCDMFIAITSERCYREGVSLNQAVIMLRKESLDDKVRTALESILNFYPVGSLVLLSDNSIGLVEKNYSHDLQRPQVRIIKKDGVMLSSFVRVDLLSRPDLRILKTIHDFN